MYSCSTYYICKKCLLDNPQMQIDHHLLLLIAVSFNHGFMCKYSNQSTTPDVSVNLNLFFATDVPGRDRAGAILSTILLSWRAPQANIRAFCAVARGQMLTFNSNLLPPNFASPIWEEGLRSIESQTVDHPSNQQSGGRPAGQDDRHYTASVQLWSRVPVVFCLGPVAVQTLLVAAAIGTKMDLFDDAHKMQDISWHRLIVSYICVSVLVCSKLCWYEETCTCCIYCPKVLRIATFTVWQCCVTTDITDINL